MTARAGPSGKNWRLSAYPWSSPPVIYLSAPAARPGRVCKRVLAEDTAQLPYRSAAAGELWLKVRIRDILKMWPAVPHIFSVPDPPPSVRCGKRAAVCGPNEWCSLVPRFLGRCRLQGLSGRIGARRLQRGFDPGDHLRVAP